MSQHYLFSASGSDGWLTCPGKVAMEQGRPDSTSSIADQGSAAHFLAAECLLNEKDAFDYLDKVIVCWTFEGKAHQTFADAALPDGSTESSRWSVDFDMATNVMKYVNDVRKDAEGGILLVEQRVEFGQLIGEPGGFGTADAIIITEGWVKIRDLKYGFRPVPSYAPQLKLYALGAIAEYEYMLDGDYQIDLKIIQPRISEDQESFVMSKDELAEFAEEAARAIEVAKRAMADFESPAYEGEWWQEYLVPSEKGCQWCKAKGECRALSAESLSLMQVPATDDGLVNLDEEMETALQKIPTYDFETLCRLYAAREKISLWVEAIEDRMLYEMQSGHKSPHFKLVRGRPGNRKWNDPAAVEKQLKLAGLKDPERFEKVLISPAAAQKLIKDPKRWAKIEPLISRNEGKICVAPSSDKREPYDPFVEALSTLPEYETISNEDLL